MAFCFDDSKNLIYNSNSNTIKFELISNAGLRMRKEIMKTSHINLSSINNVALELFFRCFRISVVTLNSFQGLSSRKDAEINSA